PPGNRPPPNCKPGGCPSNHGGCGERSGGARRQPRCQMVARSSLLRRPTPGARPARRTSSVVAALAALAPRLVRLAHHGYSDRLLAPGRPPCYTRTTGSGAGRGRTMRTMRLGGRRRGPRTLGLVLSGGGARGACQVGVCARLLEDARFAAGPAVLSGTSAGGINAALIAAGKSPREMLQFWKSIADDPPVTASAAFFDGALRSLLRLTLQEWIRWLSTTQPARAFLQRLRNHTPTRAGSLAAL